MYLTGFADEAGNDVAVQLRATKELGWRWIEVRRLNGKMFFELSDEEFEKAWAEFQEAGVGVNCIGSCIANWSRRIDEPMDSSLQEARIIIPRMQRMGTKLVRIMSFAVLPDRPPEEQMEEERFRRLREIKRLFDDEGLTVVHENCKNYGGMSWKHTLKLLDNVPGLPLVFDTGNPVFSEDYAQPEPRPKQSAWTFYEKVREHIAYVHIKDGRWDEEADKAVFTYPDEGTAEVPRIVRDLVERGYDGGISIEPHLAVVFHDDSKQSPDDVRHANYVEYGRRMKRILEEAGARIDDGPAA